MSTPQDSVQRPMPALPPLTWFSGEEVLATEKGLYEEFVVMNSYMCLIQERIVLLKKFLPDVGAAA